MKAGSPTPVEDVQGLYPHSPFTGREAESRPLRSLRMSSALASNPSSWPALGRLGILGCGGFPCKLHSPPVQPSLPKASPNTP